MPDFPQYRDTLVAPHTHRRRPLFLALVLVGALIGPPETVASAQEQDDPQTLSQGASDVTVGGVVIDHLQDICPSTRQTHTQRLGAEVGVYG